MQPPFLIAADAACRNDDDLTPAQAEGPYFTRGVPRDEIRERPPDADRMTIAGLVLTEDLPHFVPSRHKRSAFQTHLHRFNTMAEWKTATGADCEK